MSVSLCMFDNQNIRATRLLFNRASTKCRAAAHIHAPYKGPLKHIYQIQFNSKLFLFAERNSQTRLLFFFCFVLQIRFYLCVVCSTLMFIQMQIETNFPYEKRGGNGKKLAGYSE